MNEEYGKRRSARVGRWLWMLAWIALGAFLGWGAALWFGPAEHGEPARKHPGASLEGAEAANRETVWTCSMHPQIQLPEPGQCPICFMDLIPVEKEEGAGSSRGLREIRLSETARKLARIRTTEVRRGNPDVQTRLVGQVEYDETRLGTITSWVAGRIDRLYVDYTGAFVKKGQAMANIYSPELYAAQSELIQAVKSLPDFSESRIELVRESARRTVAAAREKLRLLGLTESQIEAVARRGEPADHVTLHSPLSGVVTERRVSEGMYVQTGSPIYTIADLSRVWVVLDAYESDLPWVRRGAEVEFRSDAFPGRVFRGKVVFIDPFLKQETRTVRVRLEAANPDYLLRPGMYVQAVQRSGVVEAREEEGDAPLLVPDTAPLMTGKRAVVYVAVPGEEGIYEGREVVLGPRAGDWYIVRSGLVEGERVVTRGAFRIDSALQIQARPSMMNPEAGVGPVEGRDRQAAGADKDASEAVYMLSGPAWSDLVALHEEVQSLGPVVQSGEMDAIRAGFEPVHELALRLEARAPANEGGPLWREIVMLVRNDAFLGSQAVDEGEARFLYGELLRRVEFALGAFGTEAVESAEVIAQIPEAFRRGLGEVVAAYIALSVALAADEGSVARERVETVSALLGALDGTMLPEEGRTLWMDALGKMGAGIAAIKGAPDIEAMRAGFEPLSDGLIQAVRRLGIMLDKPVYLVFCPMAFGDKGAHWLQFDEEVRNPYFGAVMLACGEVKQQLHRP